MAASNLPGIRVPVTRHEMGEVFPVGDSDALADALLRILREKRKYSEESCCEIRKMYSPDHVAAMYEELF